MFKEERPTIPADAPADIAGILRACWAGAPQGRPSASAVMVRLGVAMFKFRFKFSSLVPSFSHTGMLLTVCLNLPQALGPVLSRSALAPRNILGIGSPTP